MMSTLSCTDAVGGGSLSIEQLLRAAKLLEQNAVAMKMAGAADFFKLGEDYQERVLAAKMRSPLVGDASLGAFHVHANSTGSSRRSSPTSMISSSAHSSSPNSPESLHVAASRISAATPSFSAAIGAAPPAIAINGFAASAAAGMEGACSQARSSTSTNSSACSMSTRQSRAAHNELEKNRRANLRGYLDSLKMVLPAEADSTRDTTLSLLTHARNFMREVKAHKDALVVQRQRLLDEQARLQAQLAGECVLEEEPMDTLVCSTAPGMELLKPLGSTHSSAFSPIACTSALADASHQLLVSPQHQPPLQQVSPLFDALYQRQQQPLSMEALMLQGLLPLLPLLYPYSNYASANASTC